MLQWLRKNSRNAFIYTLFLILIAAFVFSLGGGGSLTSSRNPNNVSVVYGQAIDRGMFSNALADREREYRQILGDRWTDEMAKQFKLPEQVLLQLENRMLLRHGAEELGLRVTDTELKDRVITLPGFNTGGGFDYERYRRALAYQRKTPRQFEEVLREEMLIDKMQQFLQSSAHVSRAEVERAWRAAREKADLEFVAFDLGAYRRAIAPGDGEVKAFAAKEAAQVKSYYDSHPADYKRPEQVRVRHILIAGAPATPPEQARQLEAKAEQVAKEARLAGGDFARLAREHSADSGSAAKGGELGWLSPGQTVKPFNDAAFGSRVGAIVGPVKSDFGWHILEVLEKRPPFERKFDEAKLEIARKLLVEQRAQEAARKDARAVLAAAKGAKSLSEVPVPKSATRGTTGLFTRETVDIPKLGASAQVATTAFALTPEAPLAPEPLQVGDRLAVLRLRAKQAAPAQAIEPDLAPLRERLVTQKQQQALSLWLQAARTKAARDKKMSRNAAAIRELTGSGPESAPL
jgi:peptidyl-prolyl cis-trans isomerase D